MITGTQKREREEKRHARHAGPGAFTRLVCLVDAGGRTLWSNRAGTRNGTCLHKMVHKDCGDSRCYLIGYWQQIRAAMARQPRVDYVTYDASLDRHFRIRAEVIARAAEPPARAADCFMVVIEDAKERSAKDEWLSPEEALRVTRTQMWRRAAQHLQVQEAERRRIATELHDGLGQTLSMVKQSIDEAARFAAGAPAKLENSLQRLSSLVSAALSDMHRIAMNLQPSLLEDLGILATLSWYFRELEGTYRNVTFVRQLNVDEADVAQALRLPIFRIIQEATANALKHSRAERIKVVLDATGAAVKLSIEDNGQGFDPDLAVGKRDFSHGLGLQSMKERAELSGGSYQFQSAPGKGTRISVVWRKLKAAAGECRIDPGADTLSQSICGAPLEDYSLSKSLAVCLSCLRELPPDSPEGRTRN